MVLAAIWMKSYILIRGDPERRANAQTAMRVSTQPQMSIGLSQLVQRPDNVGQLVSIQVHLLSELRHGGCHRLIAAV